MTQRKPKTSSTKTIVFVDFDGTAAQEIASNCLLDRFAVADWRWLDRRFDTGQLSFKDRVVKGFSLLSGSRKAMIEFSQTLRLRMGFPEFVRFCLKRGWALAIVSEALDFMIEAMLKRAELDGAITPFCNRAVFHPEDGRFQGIELPYARKDCVCKMGICKGALVKDAKQRFERVVYIGDGSNDLCPARYADWVFARRKLAKRCQAEGIPYFPFEDFYDIRAVFAEKP
jgi:2,3-diketo-5-methylthio-1-phosphopentane phosphatase